MIDYAYRVELSIPGVSGATAPCVLDVLGDSLQGYSGALQDAERGDGAAPRLDFTAWATEAAANFIARITDPEVVEVMVYEHNTADLVQTYRRFAGRLVTMPRRELSADEDVYLFSAAGYLAFMDEVDVVDPLSLGAYRDEYIIDLIDAVLDDAGQAERNIAVAPLESVTPFTSRLFYPDKHRFGGIYSATDKITAMAWDGTWLWLGVGHWLVHYNPATRAREKVAELRYRGTKPELVGLNVNQWRIRDLEYSAGILYGWVETTWANLRNERAHVKIKFTYVIAAPVPVINLTDANLIYNYDRGYYVKSKYIAYDNYGGPDGLHWAYLGMRAVGDAQATYTDKALGVMTFADRNLGAVIGYPMNYGQHYLYVDAGTQKFMRGDIIHVYDSTTDHRQNLGEVLRIIAQGAAYWCIEVEFNARYNYPVGTEISWWRADIKPTPNLMLPGYRDVSVEYDETIEGPTPVDVRIERRTSREGSPAFFWAQILGEAAKEDTLPCFGPLLALGEGNEPGQYRLVGGTTYYYDAGLVPVFHVKVNDPAHFAVLPALGYWVRNLKQTETEMPGENALMYNGTAVRISNESDNKLETRGNIWLAVDGMNVYAAWNRWQRTAAHEWFYQTVWGRLHAGTVTIQGRDRVAENFTLRPPREITGFAHFDGRYWFGIKRTEPRWVNTNIQFIWTAPPQGTDKPVDFDGGLVASCLVLYDKSDWLEAGRLLKVRGDITTPTSQEKTYFISESEVVDSREITNATYSSKTYPPEMMTHVILYQVDEFPPGGAGLGYQLKVREELLDKYITVQKGVDIYGELCYAVGDSLVVGHTAVADYGEAFDGDVYDASLEEWTGEEVTPDVDGRYATATLSETSVLTGMVVVTVKDGKKILILTDKTADFSWPIPPLNEVYIRRQEGNDFNETKLYFNPVYAGAILNIDYQYYAERTYGLFWQRNNILYAVDSKGAIHRLNATAIPTWSRLAAWPVNPVAVQVAGEDVYALGTDGALMRYGLTWPGYINAEVGGAIPIDAFGALLQIAIAGDCFLGEENGTVIVKPREYSPGALIVQTGALGYETLSLQPLTQYRAVLIRYANGAAYIGPENVPSDRIYEANFSYVHDYGLALLLAQRYYDYYIGGVEIYDLTYGRETLAIPMLGEYATFLSARGDVTGRVVSYLAKGAHVRVMVERTMGTRLDIGAPLGLEGKVWV